MLLGDIIYVGILCGSLTYLGFVMAITNGYWDGELFGENWPKEGFCVSFPGTYFDSHYLSFYADLCLVVLMKLIVTKSSLPKDHPAINVLQGHIPSLAAHGVGHLSITAYFGSTEGFGTLSEKGKYHAILTFIFLSAFFVNFIRKPFPWDTKFVAVQAVVHAYCACFVVPTIYLFVYVSLVYNFNLCFYKLLREPRHQFYTMEALVHRLPIIIMTWLESLWCDSLLIYIGGHMFFDAMIPVSAILFYYVAWSQTTKSLKKD